MLRLSNWIDRQVLEKTGNQVQQKELPLPPLPALSSLPPLPPLPPQKKQPVKVVAETGSQVVTTPSPVAPPPLLAVAVLKFLSL